MLSLAKLGLGIGVPAALLALTGLTNLEPIASRSPASWNPRAAAKYLDARTIAWTSGGAMDHGTFCISCHTGLPFALARRSLQPVLAESQTPSAEQQLLDSVAKRVNGWDSVGPYLGDKHGGLPTESVLNALILSQEDARKGRMSETTKKALRIMWAQQIKTGDSAGAWAWISAGNEPWEAPDSDYWGATLAVIATADAPEGYIGKPEIQGGLKLLEAYLRRNEDGKSLFNRLSLLWSAAKDPGLLSSPHRAAIVADVLAKQNRDGGWSTASLIPPTWARRDRTAEDASSDGYGTGFVIYILEQAGIRSTRPEIQRAISWLVRNQDQATGTWPTVSPNVTRDRSTDVGKFMTDAATAYAVLALSSHS